MPGEHELYMQRCIELARLGLGTVAPNPMVGCVIVHNNNIIGEGYHQGYGYAHAEANAIESVCDKELLKSSILYVNLEPCSHYGKTPPCADLIISYGIPEVIIGMVDIFPEVSGRGIERLQKAGCKVLVDVLYDECVELNQRFITFYTKNRPYVILKWAQSADGYIDILRKDNTPAGPTWINSETDLRLVHKWRTEEQAIMVGTNTALIDNPKLTARFWPGKNPVRVVLDRTLRLPSSLALFDQSAPTIVFTEKPEKEVGNIIYKQIDFNGSVPEQVLSVLCEFSIQSLIVEGGSTLLNSFIDCNLWDEARVMTGKIKFGEGVKAPLINCNPVSYADLHSTSLTYYKNPL